jgi:hypothetical protein
MNATVSDMLAQRSVNQLLLFDRSQALEHVAYCLDVVMVALALDVEFALSHVIL